MRNLFTLNIETNEHGFDDFLMRKSEDALKAQYDKNNKEIADVIKKRFKPLLIISIVAYICGTISILIFLKFLDVAGFAQVSWALYIGIAGLTVFGIFLISALIWRHKFIANPQTQSLDQEQEELLNKIACGLGVPENSSEIDIMFRPYKIINGKEKYKIKRYANLPMWVFVEDDNLCFADTFGVWAIPLSDISSIMPFPGRAMLSAWNKAEKINSSKYKKTVRYDSGNYFVKGYYSLQIVHNDEEWEVLIPAYDIDHIYELTGKYPEV